MMDFGQCLVAWTSGVEKSSFNAFTGSEASPPRDFHQKATKCTFTSSSFTIPAECWPATFKQKPEKMKKWKNNLMQSPFQVRFDAARLPWLWCHHWPSFAPRSPPEAKALHLRYRYQAFFCLFVALGLFWLDKMFILIHWFITLIKLLFFCCNQAQNIDARSHRFFSAAALSVHARWTSLERSNFCKKPCVVNRRKRVKNMFLV